MGMPFLAAALAAAALAASAYLFWRIRWGYPPSSLPRVLAYHKVTKFEFGGTWVPPRRFVSQIDALLEAGFSFVDEETFLETVEGRREGSKNEILLTFDDGYEGIAGSLAPALEARNVPALVFLVSSFAGLENRWELYWPGRRFRHMGWDEVLDLAGRGFDFGSHTCTHRDLTRLPRDSLREELVRSKKELEGRLGRPVWSLSYPFGRTHGGVREEARLAGYRAAFTMYPSGSNGIVDRFALRREGVYIIDTITCLRSKLGRGPLFWIEDLKGRAINGFAALTPVLKAIGGDR